MNLTARCPHCGDSFTIENASDALVRSAREDVAERTRAVADAEAELANARCALELSRAYLTRAEALATKEAT